MDRFDPWWYSCIETSSRSWEWESVERTFGISRGMVDFIARVSSWFEPRVSHEKDRERERQRTRDRTRRAYAVHIISPRPASISDET
jgi:hypothetical protein